MRKGSFRFAGLVLTVLVSGCDAVRGAERGVPPGDGPAGPIVALHAGGAGERLLKAHARSLYQSRNGGLRWEAVPLPAAVQQGRIESVAAAPGAGRALYIAGSGFGVLRSEDAGKTWKRLTEGLPSRDVEAFSPHVLLDSVLFVSVAGKGLFRSEDRGGTWKRMDDGPGGRVRQIFHSGLTGSMNTGWLYAATPSEVRRTMDCFCGWRDTGPMSVPGEILGIAFNPKNPAHVYASAASGMYWSSDGGEKWEKVSSETPAVAALAFVPGSETLYGATRDGALVRSRDQGRAWERVGA